MIVEEGFELEVERNEENGSFTRKDIAKALTYAMVYKEGKEMRERAREAIDVFGDRQLQNSCIVNFVVHKGMVEWLVGGSIPA